ncbi:SDR family NAD(P)-dependent oxidoreductase [Herpetosiphon sp. NSE202]|uniref:SDR family NAD(P)-dependent oxidoreductase n=1 Tax=Herpetosiphon sp. NSE202 TaxID=3351349 RepID=UPI003636DA2F
MDFQSIQRRFTTSVEQHASHVALIDGDQVLSYGELATRAQRLAAGLAAKQIGAGSNVAMLLTKPIDVCSTLLATLLLGARYSLLSPNLAGFRLRSSLARQQLVVGTTETLALVADLAPSIEFEQLLRSDSLTIEPAAATAESIIALSYSSHPSGLLQAGQLTQANLLSFIDFNLNKAKVSFQQSLWLGAEFTDFAAFISLATLASGGTLRFSTLEALHQQDNAEQAQTLGLSLASLGQLQQSSLGLPKVRHILSSGEGLLAGEALKQQLKQQQTAWHNYYGFPALQLLTVVGEHSQVGHIHSGKPVPHTQAFILDQHKQLAPIGLTGELYVTGAGVFAGFDQAQLNAERFIASPFAADTQLYQTRYLARWHDDGRINLIGSLDSMLEVAGAPLLLQELESLLETHPAIIASCVVRRTTLNQAEALTGFVVANHKIEPSDVLSYLETQLGCQLPTLGLMQIDRLPRMADGQPDRQQLAQTSALDSRQLADLQTQLQQAANGAEVALVAQSIVPAATPLHLDDILPVLEMGHVGPAQRSMSAQPAEPLAVSDKPALAVGKPLIKADQAPFTLAEALVQAAKLYPEHGISYIEADGTVLVQSYAALLAAAKAVLAGLRAAGLQKGQHVVLQCTNNEPFVVSFWACMLGGFVAVPLAVPTSSDPHNPAVSKLYNTWQTLQQPLIVCEQASLSHMQRMFNGLGVANVAIQIVEQLRQHQPDQQHQQLAPQDAALVLFTSGSTGLPKGVELSHHNIISRSKASAQHNHFDHNDVSLNWMPLDHVGGIVMFHIHDLCLGCRQIQAKTEYILQDPVRWLDLLEQERATITWAPNFAYALINDQHERVNSRQRDLSALRFILNGGEGINKQTALNFLGLLQAHGLPASAMHPAYGMSETSSGISSSDQLVFGANSGFHELDQASLQSVIQPATSDSIGVAFVEVGAPLPGVSLRIVNADDQILGEDMIGRLQIKGPTITAGYYRNPELNQEVFTSDGWFTTGDLAFLHQGRLTIAGREKDVIIINGINYHNHEIEALVETIAGVEVSYSAACSVPSKHAGGTESLVIFYNSKLPDFTEQLEQIQQIRKVVVQKIGINPSAVLPVAKTDIPKTAIGKIQRSQLSQRYVAGDFSAISKRIDLALANEQTLPRWFYSKQWQPTSQRSNSALLKPSYAIFSDDTALARALIDVLEQQQREWILVSAGETFSQHERHYTINLNDREHYQQLVAALSAANIHDYIHLYSADLPSQITQASELAASQYRGAYSILFLTQALAEQKLANAHLTVVSQQSHAINPNDQVVYAAAPIHGLLKTIPLELDWLSCQHLDLDAAPATTNSQQICHELAQPKPTAEVAYRAGQRLVPALVQAEIEQAAPIESPLIKGGLYLITGGLGGIGSQFARWLLQTYNARLVITGSTELPLASDWAKHLNADSSLAKRIRAYKDLSDLSTDVLYQALDLTDPAQITALINTAEARWNQPLAGVFHFAGAGNLAYHWTVMERHWIANESLATFEMMFAPKVYATWALQQALIKRPELPIIAMSSINSFFGGATFSAYSAANSFLDSFMLHQRQTSHPKALCLNWTQWDNIGMSHNNPQQIRGLSAERGYSLIGVRQGLQSLLAGISQQQYPLLMIGLNGDSPALRPYIATNQPLQQQLNLYTTNQHGTLSHDRYRQLAQSYFGPASLEWYQVDALPRTSSGAIDHAALSQIGTANQHAVVDQPTTNIESQLVSIWQEILDKPKIGIHDNFFALGGHSLLATQLVSRLRDSFQLEVRLYQLFAAPTIAELATTIENLQLEQIDAADMEALLAELEGLSEEEIQAGL